MHSLKDLPTELPAGLTLGAVGQRADVRDVLIYRDVEHIVCHFDPAQPAQTGKRGFKSALNIRALPHGATLATSSTRRSAQALEMRPDLNVVPIRGNVGTRLKKVAEQAQRLSYPQRLALPAVLSNARSQERLLKELEDEKSKIEIMELKHQMDLQKVKEDYNQVISLIQENPKLAKIKTEVLKRRINIK